MKSETIERLDGYARIAVEYGMYLYVFLLFLDRGEALRNIGLLGALSCLAFRAAISKKVAFYFDSFYALFGTFVLSAVLSAAFSINPSYSLGCLKNDFLKPAAAFMVIAASANEEMILNLCAAVSASGIGLLGLGLFDFMSGKTEYYTNANILAAIDKNEFGLFIGISLSFFILLSVLGRGISRKLFWGAISVWGGAAVVMSASRGSIGNILAVLAIWFAALFANKKHIRTTGAFLAVLVLAAALSYGFWPSAIREKLESLPSDAGTFTKRTDFFWKPAFEAAMKKPVFGWGVGKKVYRDERPFEGGSKPNFELRGGLHSTFVSILFHQGFFGLAAYLAMLFYFMAALFSIFRGSPDNSSHMIAVALLSVLAGSFLINSFVLSVPLIRLAPVAGMTAALCRKS